MATKLEIELTSQLNNDSWTWRAAGARSPKGTVATQLLYDGAKIGDVTRAEVSMGLDGIEILSVSAPTAKKTPDNRLELIGSSSDEPLVNISLKKKGRTERPNRGPREGGNRSRQGGERERQRQSPRGRQGQTPTGPQGSADRPQRSGERQRPAGQDRPQRTNRTTTSDRRRPNRPEAKRLHPKEIHRKEVLDSLLPEHRPIGEALVKGGLPAVRAAIAEQNALASAAGDPVTPVEATLKIAEGILPRIRVATWLDRAEAANEIVQEISLKDLRAILAAADRSAKNPQVTELFNSLSGVLAARSSTETDKWQKEVASAIDENRLVRALRLAAKLPDPSAKLPAELAARLVELCNAEMNADTPSERWMVLIDAVAQSPIRRQVQPTSLPSDATPELIEFAKENAGRIPALAQLTGVSVPPPPRPEILAMVPKTSRPARSAPPDEATTDDL
ncbi:hypothetical protein [Ferrimicrobium sp.]|uniref:hypothetical protein n=1 Tax=Ferrimicrobium sp. TaxID=2926050 RepID=UPI002637CD5B|nr:hypothetical protein [Ferrimicrobium sp.]